MPSIFSQIIDGKIPCFRIEENNEFLAFLDINPLVVGHVLVIYKQEIDYIFDLDDDVLGRMLVFSKKVAKRIKSKIQCQKMRKIRKMWKMKMFPQKKKKTMKKKTWSYALEKE